MQGGMGKGREEWEDTGDSAGRNREIVLRRIDRYCSEEDGE